MCCHFAKINQWLLAFEAFKRYSVLNTRINPTRKWPPLIYGKQDLASVLASLHLPTSKLIKHSYSNHPELSMACSDVKTAAWRKITDSQAQSSIRCYPYLNEPENQDSWHFLDDINAARLSDQNWGILIAETNYSVLLSIKKTISVPLCKKALIAKRWGVSLEVEKKTLLHMTLFHCGSWYDRGSKNILYCTKVLTICTNFS